MNESNNNVLYIFLDEGGNFDFSSNGTKYFILTALSKERPFNVFNDLINLKYDFIERGLNIEYFHASEDRQEVRNGVFKAIENHMSGIRIDSVIVEKSKTNAILKKTEKFYPEMLGHLIRHVINSKVLSRYKEIIIFTDAIPDNKKKKSIEKSVKMTLADMMPSDTKYSIYHHQSRSNMDLQVVDYCNWAIYRKWDRNDERSYKIIQNIIKSELNF